MKTWSWTRIVYIAGVSALVIGILDPLEGSVLITAGILLICISAFSSHDKFLKKWLIAAGLIVSGVFFLFYFSSLGGFGEGALSWWLIIFTLPYPAGWVYAVSLVVKKSKMRRLEKIA